MSRVVSIYQAILFCSVNKTTKPGHFMRQKPCRFLFFLFICFVALRPKSTAMVMAGRSVDLTTLFPGQA